MVEQALHLKDSKIHRETRLPDFGVSRPAEGCERLLYEICIGKSSRRYPWLNTTLTISWEQGKTERRAKL